MLSRWRRWKFINPWKVINRDNECNLKDVEVGITNKFNWSWLEKALTLTRKDRIMRGRCCCSRCGFAITSRLASRRYRENGSEKNCKLQSRKRKLGIVSQQASERKKKAKEVLRKKAEKERAARITII